MSDKASEKMDSIIERNNPKIPEFIMMVGLPASGKSTFAKELAEQNGAIICSSDEIRREIFGDENCQDDNTRVFKILHNRIKENLKNGNNVIYDATNLSEKRRRAFLQELEGIACEKKCLIMATPIGDCCNYNLARERRVPGFVMDKMYRNYNPPYWYEGWDMIGTQYPENFRATKTVGQWLAEFANFDQNNHHHSLTLAKHCLATEDNLCNIITVAHPTLRMAALIHDCGKPYTKTNINSRGFMTKDSHYYNHNCVGAYESLFFDYGTENIDVLDVSALVYLHMMPLFWRKNAKGDEEKFGKLCNRYEKLWGGMLYRDVMALHVADVAAT